MVLKVGVKYRTANQMKNIINTFGKELGVTQDGRNWCLKALHPSESVPVVGIPDRSGQQTAMLNYTSRFEITDPAASATSWGVDLSLLPHPIAMLAATFRDNTDTFTQTATFYNPQVGDGTLTVQQRFTAWRAFVQRYRLAYASATVELDATALTDSGNVSAAQYPVKKVRHTFQPNERISDLTSAAGIYQLGASATAGSVATNFSTYCVNSFSYQANDEPDYSTLVNMPRAFVGQAREGVYMPLIIDSVEQKWFGESNMSFYGGVAGGEGAIYGSTITTVVDDAVIVSGAYQTSAAAWPFAKSGAATTTSYVRPNSARLILANIANPALNTVMCMTGDQWVPMCNATVGHMCFKNLNPAAKLVVTVRMGWEIEAQPGTTYSMMLQPSPLHDPVSLDMYYYIRHRMADAYPAEYNDLNKLLQVLIAGARASLPILSMMHPSLKAVTPIGEAVLTVADKMRSKFLGGAVKDMSQFAQAKQREKDAKARVMKDLVGVRRLTKRGK